MPLEIARNGPAIAVGPGELEVSADPAVYLVSQALGSCIAVALYDPGVRAAGMLHFVLPDSRAVQAPPIPGPALFADTGIPLLLERMREAGSTGKGLRVRLAGGAELLAGAANAGKRNYLAARKVLWRLGLTIESESVGGTAARNLGVEVASGRFWVRHGQ